MAKFKITPTTTVAELKEQFRNEIGGVLRVYEGRSQAPADATLVSLGAKEGELECRTSRTVGKFEEAFQKDLNLKVKVYTKDENVSVLDGITLATVREIPNMSTHAKMEKYLSYKREENDDIDDKMNNTVDWDTDTVEEVYKYMSIEDLTAFLNLSSLKAKMCDASDFPFIFGEKLTAALKIVEGFCYCALCETDNSKDQWETAGNDGHGVCVKIDVNYSGWNKGSVYYSKLSPVFEGGGISAVDAMTIKPLSKHNDLKEIIFIRKAKGNDSLPYRVKDVIMGSNMTEEERQKCNAILSSNKTTVKTEKRDETDSKKATSTDTKNNKNGVNNDEQLILLNEELDKILDYNLSDRIKKMFFELIPDGTIIYSTDGDYEKQKVALAIDCAVVDFKANCCRFVKAVKFKVEDGGLYAIECLSDDEDEIWDCFWNLDNFPANYRALSDILNEYRNGNHSIEDDITLIPQCEAEEEDDDD